ncbi:MAG: TetR/AcrR family transcriptional regulator [Deltaproteobacteria bacterium]|nr:MAG: TetR/AcrR family transcriptional regulator [Deltaproteobacteria bacterium]
MKYAEFIDGVPDSRLDICRGVFMANREKIKIKKEKTILKNLEKIFDATLKIGIEKGFQAMTMRDLSSESGLSMGALYSYFSSKEEILRVSLSEGRKIVWQILDEFIEKEKEAVAKLEIVLEVHLFLTEKMHKWFYFSYMEAKNLNPEERKNAVQNELYTEKLIEGILIEGQKKGVFRETNHEMAASVIKAMLQDWYLKRGKYSKRNITVDQYAQFIIGFIRPFYLKP